MKKYESDEFAKKAEHALQDAVGDAIEQHRKAGKSIVVARDGKPTRVDPSTVKTVREQRAEYGKAVEDVTPADEGDTGEEKE